MTTSYGEVYTKLVDEVNTKYLPFHNLYLLKSYRAKTDCYSSMPADRKVPSQYYQCFEKIEHELINNSKEFQKDYQNIEDEYNICIQNCKDQGESQSEVCRSDCAKKWKRSVEILYSNFYKARVGNEKEYRKIKK